MAYDAIIKNDGYQISFASEELGLPELTDGLHALEELGLNRGTRFLIVDLSGTQTFDFDIATTHTLLMTTRALFALDDTTQVAVVAQSAAAVSFATDFVTVRDLLTDRNPADLPDFRVFDTLSEAENWVAIVDSPGTPGL